MASASGSTLTINAIKNTLSGSVNLLNDKGEAICTVTADEVAITDGKTATAGSCSGITVSVAWSGDTATGSAAGTYENQTYRVSSIPVAISHAGERGAGAGG